MPPENLDFSAYELFPAADMPLRPAPFTRDWMDATPQRFAYHCLPLVMANQAGWVIGSPATFTATWDGGPASEGLRLHFEDHSHSWVQTHFGSGVLTFTLPYLFRTPPGVNLWVKGPANLLKDGVQALEGVVETDWTPATFTMNWKMTRPNHPVRFERGEPVCMLVPVPRHLAEQLLPRQLPLADNAALAGQYAAWAHSRQEFQARLREGAAAGRALQKDYHKGEMPRGARAPEHQTRLHLREFVRGEAPVGSVISTGFPAAEAAAAPVLVGAPF